MEEFKSFRKIHRLHRLIFITEKIDGSNAHIHVLESGEVLSASRNRYLTEEDDNHGFFKWVKENEQELKSVLGIGRHYGEWWGGGINRGYGIKEKRFSLFNIKRWNDENKPVCCEIVPILGISETFNIDLINFSLKCLKNTGSFAEKGFMNPEGIVIFHEYSKSLFKVTLEGDDKPKSLFGS